MREARVRAGASRARWHDARGLRGLVQPPPARRVGRRGEDLASSPFRTGVRTLRDRAARVSRDGARASFAARGKDVPRDRPSLETVRRRTYRRTEPDFGAGTVDAMTDV